MWDIVKRKKALSLSNSRQVDGRANGVKLPGLIGQNVRARHGHHHSHRISTASAETQFSIVHRVVVDVTAVVEAAVE
ncbi:COP1-interactive protein [Trichinella spiralis]|uniref:COP1-interactive protein n=1 Tax=Trichinella spiralis TaxID=6334 RepID=A0ABR3KPN6_TRISP